FDTALEYVLDRVSRDTDAPHRDAAVVLHGLRPVVVPAKSGQAVDRRQAATAIVRALSSLSRESVTLPVRVDLPRVKADDLTVIVAEVKTALSAPMHLTLG